ncbi:hypothetical protein SLS62_000312 [Diatrype stigma]|uniref:Uncharacterized protein n=1 Tax=Diatrype stigma TaxID=117547 RepID=A0AAN9VB61_9PEZI
MDYTQVPYPRLPMQVGDVDQRLYFLEPAVPSHDQVGQPKPFPAHQTPSGHYPASFGKGARLYETDDTEAAPGSRIFFARRSQDQGTIHHGIQRGNSEVYELAKFNKLLHPGDDGKNTNLYQAPGDWKDMPEDLKNQLKLKTWPLSFEVPTLAPFTQSRFGFSKTQAKQSTALGAVAKTPEIFNMIVSHLIGSWEDMSNLSRTCQLLFKGIGIAVTHCDLKSANFLDIDKSEQELRWLVINGQRTREQANVEVCPFLLVSPIRREFNESKLSSRNRINEHGYIDTREMLFEEPRITDTFMQNLKLYRAILHRPDQFRHLLLQRVPFTNISAVKAIIRSLPNLKTLGVHNCDLMTFGDTSMLLKAVRDANLYRFKKDNKTRLDVDFYPRYFQGPILGSLGCFGVIPHDEGKLDIPRAVVAGLLHLIPLAVSANIDILTPGKAFRRFLDKLPFPIDTLPYILDAILNLVDYRKGRHGDLATLMPEQKHDMEMTLWIDIIVATNGGPIREKVLKAALVSRLDDKRIILYRCKDCEEDIPKWFYTDTCADRRHEFRVCHGCQMVAYLAQHHYNMHVRKREIADRLWDYGQIADVRTLMGAPLIANNDQTLAATMHNLVAPGSRQLNHRLRLAKAWVRHLQNHYYQDQARIVELEKRIADMKALAGTLTGNDPELWDAEDEIKAAKKELVLVRIRVGRGQWDPRAGSGLAVSWQRLIDEYRGKIAVATGQLVNSGPYSLMNKDSFARDCTGW